MRRNRHNITGYTLIAFLVLFPIYTWSQTATIKGRVVDATTDEPVPFANTFLNNTTLGAVSDENGFFIIKGIRLPAVHEIVVSFIGYNSYNTRLNINSAEIDLGIIKLTTNKVQLNDVEVRGTRDSDWERKIKRFTKVFLGSDAMARQCKIKNPWVIDFQDEVANGGLIATAKEPIMIENEALGYNVAFYLKQFVATNTTYLIKGDVRFENRKSTLWEVLKKWEENRKNAYYGSSQHMFKSILNKRIDGEGFNLYLPMDGYENERSSLFSEVFKKTIFPVDTTQLILPGTQNRTHKISWNGTLEVHYRKKKAIASVYQDLRYPLSWITTKKGVVLVNNDGIVLNPSDVITSGAMSENRVALMLPLDYTPLDPAPDDMPLEHRNSYNLLYEKVYVHTDKNYYYPGETIWMRGYVQYSSQYFRDSLSKTIYTDLIHGKSKKILQSRILELDSGFFQCDYILPDTLKPSDYFIRAYTNWNRNYGDENLYLKYLPVLDLQQRPQPDTVETPRNTDNIKVKTLQDTYHTGEEISVKVEIKDSLALPVFAILSVSVTDATQVVNIKMPDIIDGLRVLKAPTVIQTPNFNLEYGLPITGQIKYSKSKPRQELINILQPSTGSFYLVETDLTGLLKLNGLKFYGSSDFIVQQDGVSKKKREIKRVKLVERKIPDVFLPQNHISIPQQKVSTDQRELSTFELPAHTRLLKEVLVKNKKEQPDKKERPYGKPDYILSGEKLNQGYGNLLLTLQGKVPGLVVRQDPNGQWLVYAQRAGSSSISNAREVLVMVNDVFVSGNAADVLGAINIANVESVEVQTGINVLYGGMGGNGIVSVYTKQGAQDKTRENIQLSFTAEGYYLPRSFPANKAGEVAGPDYRSLLYWNPDLVVNKEDGYAEFSFFAADLEGQYRIVIEGVTEEGDIVRTEHLVSISKKN